MSQELGLSEWKHLIVQLAKYGCQKLNFAGGEPTLISFLPELIRYAKFLDLFVSIISNGTGITKNFLNQCAESLDVVGLSIDSSSDLIERELGRAYRFNPNNKSQYSHIDLIKNRANLIKDYRISLKINTTITPLNWMDDMRDLISELAPMRWKVLEVHRIHNINDNFFETYGELKSWQFESFIKRHAYLNPICETSEMIMNSYCMISPDGRFYQNSGNCHHYSDLILKVGAIKAFNQLKFSYTKYKLRQGDYFKR
jgi:radical S-adenosyl methionine domain-containing protein 2